MVITSTIENISKRSENFFVLQLNKNKKISNFYHNIINKIYHELHTIRQ